MSLASDYAAKEGCNDGVAKLSVIVQHYISQRVVGGRCMTSENKMYHIVKKIADFDACSLYPSAMHRMDGLLQGEPQILQSDQLSYDFLQKQDGYFIRALLKKVGVHRKFPLLSAVNDTGVRVFNNDMVGNEIHLDKVGLEDLMTFQDVEFEVIDGYYFNQERSDKIEKVIKHPYDLRKKMRNENKPKEV